jgi:hypothetical protein
MKKDFLKNSMLPIPEIIINSPNLDRVFSKSKRHAKKNPITISRPVFLIDASGLRYRNNPEKTKDNSIKASWVRLMGGSKF